MSCPAHAVVVTRRRAWLKSTRHVREVLLVLGADGQWVWPAHLPSRFQERVVDTLASLPPQPRWGDVGVTVVHVASNAYDTPPTRGLADMRVHGAWVVDHDFCEQGGIEALGVAPRAAVFGIPIAPAARAVFSEVQPLLPPADVQPLALYHGTDASAAPDICRAGLLPSFGMLGTAVSLGTFWKATRYAAMNHAYERRAHGIVVRAYLDPGRIKVMDGTGVPCPCATCGDWRERAARYARRMGLPASYDMERTRVADHVGSWMAEGYDTAYVPVVKCSGGGISVNKSQHVKHASKDDIDRSKGVPMFANKNEEYAVARPHERLEVQCVALLDMGSMAHPDWNPLQRTQTIE